MSINLMDMVKHAIEGQVMGQLGGLLGEGDDATGKAVESGIPAIIGGLFKKASSPSGATDLFGTLDQHDGSLLDNLGGVLDGDSAEVEASGESFLSSLFGDGLGGVVEMVAKLAGVRSGSAGKLLTLLAPIVMGVLGRQRQKQGLDVGGFTNLLMSQKNNLAEALPSEMSSQLGIAELLQADVPEAVAAPIPTHHPDQNHGGGGIMKFLLPLFLLGAIGYFLVNTYGDYGGATQGVDDADLEIPEVELPSIEIPSVDPVGTESDDDPDGGSDDTIDLP